MAALAMVAVVGWIAAPAALLRLQADHVTGTAELRTIALEDGSTVMLAPDSAVAVTYRPSERQVQILQGEAFFAVTPNKDRPFTVTARSVRTSVLGTRFDVGLDDAGVEVAVEEGRVRVDSGNTGEILSAGEVVQVAATGELVRTALEPGAIALWRQGRVYLRNRPLAEAVNAIRRYYPGKIVVTDAALEKQPTTGVFDMTDPEAALRGLAQAHGATVRRLSPWLLVVSGS
jgi:transmembrane sensor